MSQPILLKHGKYYLAEPLLLGVADTNEIELITN
jgi:hypothetical protein